MTERNLSISLGDRRPWDLLRRLKILAAKLATSINRPYSTPELRHLVEDV